MYDLADVTPGNSAMLSDFLSLIMWMMDAVDDETAHEIAKHKEVRSYAGSILDHIIDEDICLRGGRGDLYGNSAYSYISKWRGDRGPHTRHLMKEAIKKYPIYNHIRTTKDSKDYNYDLIDNCIELRLIMFAPLFPDAFTKEDVELAEFNRRKACEINDKANGVDIPPIAIIEVVE